MDDSQRSACKELLAHAHNVLEIARSRPTGVEILGRSAIDDLMLLFLQRVTHYLENELEREGDRGQRIASQMRRLAATIEGIHDPTKLEQLENIVAELQVNFAPLTVRKSEETIPAPGVSEPPSSGEVPSS